METRHCGEVANKIRLLKDLSGRKVKIRAEGETAEKTREEGEEKNRGKIGRKEI